MGVDKTYRFGMIVDNSGALRPIQATVDQLKTLANGGREATATLKGLSGGMTQAGAQAEAAARRTGTLTDSILRMKRASAERLDLGLAAQITQLDPFQRKLTEATGAANAHKLSLGRLGQQFGNLAGSIAGTNPIVGNLLSVMGSFAIGSAFTVGILGGLALVAVAYDKITEGARKARLENEGLTKSLADQFAPKTGPDSETALRYAGALRQQADAMMRLKLLQGSSNDFGAAAAFRSAGLAAPTFGRDVEIQNETERLRLANRALGRARAGGAGILETVTTTDPYDKAKVESDRVAKDKFEAEERSRRFELAARQEGYRREAQRFNLVPDNVPVPGTPGSLIQGMSQAEQKHIETLIRMDEEYVNAKAVFSSTTAAVDDFKKGVKGAVTGLLEQLSPSNIASGMVQGLVDQATGFVKGLIGSAVGGLRRSVFGESGAEKAAAREAEATAQAMRLAMQSLRATLTGDTLGAAIAQAQNSLISTLAAINTALPGTKNESERNRMRDEAARLEKQQEDQLRRQDALSKKYATEDLEVRNLRATGQGDGADRLAFQQQQQREMQAAIDANKDATYLSYLATVQNNELIAYQNGLLATAMRNAPTGFYGIEGYAGAFATPRGPAGYPTDSGPINSGPDNAHPGGDWSSGKGSKGGSRGTINIQLMMDGKQIMRTIAVNLDEVASSTGGAGTSRGAACEYVKR